MPYFKSKTDRIEAMLFSEETKDQVYSWALTKQMNVIPSWENEPFKSLPIIKVPIASGGKMVCKIGDYLMFDPLGIPSIKLMPVAGKLFEMTYTPAPTQPEIITMCGSTRYADIMAAISWELEKLGKIVLRVNYVPEWYASAAGWVQCSHGAEQDGLKKELDELHCRKIDLCDRVVVCNVNTYIGESTTNEIAYARSINKPVLFLYEGLKGNDPLEDKNEFSEMAAKILSWREKA